MTVYVDDMAAPFGRLIMYHMIAVNDDELHQMARVIGVDRKWHQAPPRHDSHYDISKGKRDLALRLGAVAITWRDCAMMTIRRRWFGPDEPLVSPEEGYRMLIAGRDDHRRPKAYDYLPIILAIV